MTIEQEETKATPGDEGASILDRLERRLAGEDVPEQVETSQEDKPASESVDPEDGGEKSVDQPQLSTSDFAKLLGVDEAALTLEEDGTVKFKTKIDGAEGAAKLADVLKSYQLEGHVNKRSMELAEREKAQQAKAQEAEAQFAHRLQYAEGLANVAAQQLMQEFQSIDWKALEQQDAGTAALWRQKFQERQAQLRGVFHNIQQEKAQAEQKSQAATHEALAKEAAKLPQLIPEWKDEAVATKEKAEILAWATKIGMEAADMQAMTAKAHFVALMRKAMLADQLQAKKPEIENKVRLAPKLVKPGQPSTVSSQAQAVQNARTAVKKSGGKRDAVEAYLLAAGKV